MKEQIWIFTVRYWRLDQANAVPNRWAVAGPACIATAEAAFQLAQLPKKVRAEICADTTIRRFVEGQLAADRVGYYVQGSQASSHSWVVCLGSIQKVIS